MLSLTSSRAHAEQRWDAAASLPQITINCFYCYRSELIHHFFSFFARVELSVRQKLRQRVLTSNSRIWFAAPDVRWEVCPITLINTSHSVQIETAIAHNYYQDDLNFILYCLIHKISASENHFDSLIRWPKRRWAPKASSKRNESPNSHHGKEQQQESKK